MFRYILEVDINKMKSVYKLINMFLEIFELWWFIIYIVFLKNEVEFIVWLFGKLKFEMLIKCNNVGCFLLKIFFNSGLSVLDKFIIIIKNNVLILKCFSIR